MRVAGLKIVQKDPEDSGTIFLSLSDERCLLIPVPIFSAQILGFINNDVLDHVCLKFNFHESFPGHCLANIFCPVTVKRTLGIFLTASMPRDTALLSQVLILSNSQESGSLKRNIQDQTDNTQM